MKINVEIPDNIIDGRDDILIHNGRKLIAIGNVEGNWTVKTRDCSQCGACCRNLSPNFPYRDENGDCIYLKDNKCSVDFHRPFSCLSNYHNDPSVKPKTCTEEFKEL